MGFMTWAEISCFLPREMRHTYTHTPRHVASLGNWKGGLFFLPTLCYGFCFLMFFSCHLPTAAFLGNGGRTFCIGVSRLFHSSILPGLGIGIPAIGNGWEVGFMGLWVPMEMGLQRIFFFLLFVPSIFTYFQLHSGIKLDTSCVC